MPIRIVLFYLLCIVVHAAVQTSANNAGKFYSILGVPSDADSDQIKKAYRKLAMKYHPDKNPDKKAECEAKLKEINEAYETLSDPKKKQTYDLYGQDSFPNFQPSSSSSAASSSWTHPFYTSHNNNFEYEQQGFSFSNNGDMGSVFNDLFSQFFPGSTPRSSPFQSYGPSRRSGFSSSSSSSSRGYSASPRKAIEKDIHVTLEELYTGCVKKMRVRDTVLSSQTGRMQEIEKVVVLDIKPGWKAGTKITFKATPDFPLPIVFTIRETKHRYFERRGDDLRWKCRLTKRQVENGVVVKLPLLDGSKLVFNSKDDEVRNGAKRPFKGLGMPISKPKGSGSLAKTAGDLIVKFEVILDE